jgi:hypothetical protein
MTDAEDLPRRLGARAEWAGEQAPDDGPDERSTLEPAIHGAHSS